MSMLDQLPVALPLDRVPPLQVLASDSDGSRVDVVAADLGNGVTVATHRKYGWRWTGGRAMALDPHLENTARFALLGLPSARLPVDAPREAREQEEIALVDLAAQVHKPTVWPPQGFTVDGRPFALFVTTTDAGQAAVADLGPVRLALWGPALPPALALRLVPISTLELQPRLAADNADTRRTA